MKLFLKSTALALMIGLFSCNSTTAQPPAGQTEGKPEMSEHHGRKHHPMIPDLTEKQQEQIKAIHMAAKKDMKTMKLDIQENEAKLEKELIKDQPNEVAAYAFADKIASQKAMMHKSKIKTRLEIRSILTDTQKDWFDTHIQKRGHHGQRGHHGKKNCDGSKCQKK